jgi:hypothetical protein
MTPSGVGALIPSSPLNRKPPFSSIRTTVRIGIGSTATTGPASRRRH